MEDRLLSWYRNQVGLEESSSRGGRWGPQSPQEPVGRNGDSGLSYVRPCNVAKDRQAVLLGTEIFHLGILSWNLKVREQAIQSTLKLNLKAISEALLYHHLVTDGLCFARINTA